MIISCRCVGHVWNRGWWIGWNNSTDIQFANVDWLIILLDFLLLFVYDSLVVGLLLSYPVDVRRVDLVPGRHVLFHARRHARLFAAREGAAGLGDAFLEAVFLEFLQNNNAM